MSGKPIARSARINGWQIGSFCAAYEAVVTNLPVVSEWASKTNSETCAAVTETPYE